MLAQDYLNSALLEVSAQLPVSKAAKRLKEARQPVAAVVTHWNLAGSPSWNELIGQISLAALEKYLQTQPAEAHQTTVEDSGLVEKVFVWGNQHIFDAVKMAVEMQTGLVPVADNHNHYLGTIGPHEFLRVLADAVAFRDPGPIIVLDVERHQYSPTQIANIVESNRAMLLHLSLSPSPDPQVLRVHLKLNCLDLTSVVLGFERFGYRVTQIFADEDLQSVTRDHYQALMHYLNA